MEAGRNGTAQISVDQERLPARDRKGTSNAEGQSGFTLARVGRCHKNRRYIAGSRRGSRQLLLLYDIEPSTRAKM